MTDPTKPDHDQRLKVLLKEFFRQFFLCFFPVWADRFDFDHVDWLDKEVFLAPPQGEKRQLDLVARIRLRDDAPPVREGVTDLVALVHVELESRESAVALRPRMYEYYVQLRRDTDLPVLPIGVFLRVGLEGIGAALSSLMRVPQERRAELYAEALKRIAKSGENDFRRYLLAECLEVYTNLDEVEKERLQALLSSEQYQEVRPIMITTYERGMVAGERRLALLQLEEKFGTLSPEVKQRVETLSLDEFRRTMLAFRKAESLKELGLEDR